MQLRYMLATSVSVHCHFIFLSFTVTKICEIISHSLSVTIDQRTIPFKKKLTRQLLAEFKSPFSQFYQFLIGVDLKLDLFRWVNLVVFRPNLKNRRTFKNLFSELKKTSDQTGETRTCEHTGST